MTLLTHLMAAERRRELTRLAAECRPRPTPRRRRWWRRSAGAAPAPAGALAPRALES